MSPDEAMRAELCRLIAGPAEADVAGYYLAEADAILAAGYRPTAQAVKVATGGAPPLTPEGIDSVDVLSEGACPECGGDIMARTKGGLFLDSDRAWCNECGFQGQVTTDSETPAYFDYQDTPTQADAKAIPSPAPQAPPPEGKDRNADPA